MTTTIYWPGRQPRFLDASMVTAKELRGGETGSTSHTADGYPWTYVYNRQIDSIQLHRALHPLILMYTTLRPSEDDHRRMWLHRLYQAFALHVTINIIWSMTMYRMRSLSGKFNGTLTPARRIHQLHV